MNSKIKILVAVLFLVIVASATETTWRHSGFEVALFDMNFSSTFNVTELRVLEWGWNTSTPSVSNANRARMYYDDNNKRMMQSIDGDAYEPIVTNVTVDPHKMNATNLTNPLPAINGSSLFGLKMSNQTMCTGNATCTYNTNGSVSLDAISNITAIFNRILNTSTVTITRHANNSIELVATAATTKTVINITQNYTIGAANTTGTLFTCHANSGTQNITLPTGVNGTEFSIKKKDATGNSCSVFSSQKIDGAQYANLTLQYESITMVFAEEWGITGNYRP